MFTQKTTVFLLSLLLPCSVLSGKSDRQIDIALVKAFPNLSFTKPVFITHSHDGSNRLFVVQQNGIIKTFDNELNVSRTQDFLNIQNKINTSEFERGLLGLAFHPEFSSNGYFYVNYTAGSGSRNRTVISRFEVNPNDINQADPNSELVILEILQPFTNHNGGMLQFGPVDGYLYIATGDGGSGGDPLNNGQNLNTLLGAILRIDVDNPSENRNYEIPPDNPFLGMGVKEEIWAYGLRNPWRFSFDSSTHELWVGDVGQSRWEEIDILKRGQNYGWNITEGFDCFNASSCNSTNLTPPIKVYGHSGNNCSVTGGYVYRGILQPALSGAYIYGDFCTGNIWLLRYENDQLLADSLLLNSSLNISSFGTDENNELYIVDHNGQIYRFSRDTTTGDVDHRDQNPVEDYKLFQNYPNPFNASTIIQYYLNGFNRVRLTVYNMQGQVIKTLVNTYKAKGDHQIDWNGLNERGESVASGIYYYQLKTDSKSFTRKMIYLR
ncbi:MAG: PQQ-dependent sugar dehydrogenase [bacterium]